MLCRSAMATTMRTRGSSGIGRLFVQRQPTPVMDHFCFSTTSGTAGLAEDGLSDRTSGASPPEQPTATANPKLRLSTVGRDLLKTSFRSSSPEEVYTQWAANYDADSFGQLGFSSPAVSAQVVIDHLPRDATTSCTILDMGCGTGALGGLLKNHPNAATAGLLELDGSDLTPAMLEEATKKGCYRSLKRVDISQTPWPYPDNHYDMVTCCGVLIYVQENLEAVLQEFCRVLKVGGHAVLQIREDDAAKWEPAMATVQHCWNMTHQTDKKDNFENVTSEDGKVWYRIKVFTKIRDL